MSYLEIEDGVLKSYSGNEASVIIPDSVTTIGFSAFSNCTNLKEVVFPQHLENIHARAFANCSSLVRADIPESVSTIESFAFVNCLNLEHISIPKNIGWLGGEALNHCPKLEVDKEVKKKWSWAFTNIESITSLVIPDGTKEIPNCSLLGCTNLEKIVIPSSVKKISGSVFDMYDRLKEIQIANTLYIIHKKKIEGLTFLDYVEVKEVSE